MSEADAMQTQASPGTVLRHAITLGLFALGAALLLALVNRATEARSTDQRLAPERALLAAVFPEALHDNDLLAASLMIDPAANVFADIDRLGLDSVRPAYRATLRGRPSGVILPLATPDGYSGNITLLIGISADGTITGVRVVQHGETRGLGANIELGASNWILGFDNRSLANTDEVLWGVKKDGGDFDQFVGATITPRAVVTAIHDALLFFDTNRTQLLQLPE